MTTVTAQALRKLRYRKSHEKERPKRKALRRPRKTDRGNGRDVGQTVPSTAAVTEGPIADGGQPCTIDI